MNVTYDSQGRMKYHPELHPNTGKPWTQDQEKKEKKEIKTDPCTGELEDKYYYVNVGYFGKIYYALQAFKELQIRNSDVASVKELMNLIKELDFKIEKLLGGN